MILTAKTLQTYEHINGVADDISYYKDLYT